MFKHTSNQGITVLVAEMEDDHLMNTINVFCSKIKAARIRLDSNIEISNSSKHLYDTDKIDERAIGKSFKTLTEKVSKYVFEASVRGLDVSKKLQDAYGRKGSLAEKISIDVSPNSHF